MGSYIKTGSSGAAAPPSPYQTQSSNTGQLSSKPLGPIQSPPQGLETPQPSGPVIEINSEQEYKNLMALKGKLIVLDIYADWCQPCKFLAPKYRELAAQMGGPNVLFCKMNSEKQIRTDIQGLPTIEFFFNGQKMGTVMGPDLKKITETVQHLKGQYRLQ
jgi:thiol-disulfide isomerase/thioredoxin